MEGKPILSEITNINVFIYFLDKKTKHTTIVYELLWDQHWEHHKSSSGIQLRYIGEKANISTADISKNISMDKQHRR